MSWFPLVKASGGVVWASQKEAKGELWCGVGQPGGGQYRAGVEQHSCSSYGGFPPHGIDRLYA